jgi:hypothetical protein
MKEIQKYFTGDLIEVIEAKDQSKYEANHVGKIGIVVSKLTCNGVYSLNNYSILVDGELIRLHSLDMKLLSGVDRNEI